jgi:hypothetical protein
MTRICCCNQRYQNYRRTITGKTVRMKCLLCHRCSPLMLPIPIQSVRYTAASSTPMQTILTPMHSKKEFTPVYSSYLFDELLLLSSHYLLLETAPATKNSMIFVLLVTSINPWFRPEIDLILEYTHS